MISVQDQNIASGGEESLGVPSNDQHVPDFFMMANAKPKRKGLKLGRKSSVIVRNAGHIMPFPVNVAYETFSDFSRHSEWDPNVKSATFLDPQRTKVRWVRETMGFTIGWTTVTTVQEPNKSLAWKSIEGIKLESRVMFQPVDEGKGALMIMSTSYKVPEKVFSPTRKLIGGKNKGPRASNQAVESQRMMKVLEGFSEVVLKEMEEQKRKLRPTTP